MNSRIQTFGYCIVQKSLSSTKKGKRGKNGEVGFAKNTFLLYRFQELEMVVVIVRIGKSYGEGSIATILFFIFRVQLRCKILEKFPFFRGNFMSKKK